MDNENKGEFKTKYTLDYKTYKEFSVGYMATKKSSVIILLLFLALFIVYLIYKRYEAIIGCSLLFIILIIIFKIAGLNKLQYKRYRNLNNNEDMETNISIGKEKIVLTSKKGDTSSYEFNQIIGIIETKNLLILKLKYNMGIIINKNEIEGGTREELIEYLFSVCNNIKKKKVISSKIWLVIRRLNFILLGIIFLVSIILLVLKPNYFEEYRNTLIQNGYEVEIEESVYNGHDTKQLIISKDYEHTWSYMYEFGTDEDAKRNLEYWANIETENYIKDEYIVENNKNFQKYVIDDGQYVILIRKDNYVFYGIGHSKYKDELDNLVNMFEKDMKL